MPDRYGRIRRQLRFWLDESKPEQATIYHELLSRKQKRQYIPTIRDALRLFFSLARGETALLYELFPTIRDQLRQEFIVDAQGLTALHSEIHHIRLLMEQGEINATPSPRASAQDMPIDFEVRQATNSDDNPTYNFMLATVGIGGRVADLPAEVIAYGLKTGRLSADQVPAQATETAPSSPEPGGIKSIAGADVPLKIPAFDDDFLDDLL